MSMLPQNWGNIDTKITPAGISKLAEYTHVMATSNYIPVHHKLLDGIKININKWHDASSNL